LTNFTKEILQCKFYKTYDLGLKPVLEKLPMMMHITR
jgi:hypothetical protein